MLVLKLINFINNLTFSLLNPKIILDDYKEIVFTRIINNLHINKI